MNISMSDNTFAYKAWVENQDIPIVRGLGVKDLRTLPLKPWEQKGGRGSFVILDGAAYHDDAYVCEIAPGGKLTPQRHLFEELIYVLDGVGSTLVWNDENRKQSFEWKRGSLFSIPLNTWHQHVNGQGYAPTRYLSVTTAPLVMNLFHNYEFVFENTFNFHDRFDDREKNFFDGSGTARPGRVWESNFVANIHDFTLQNWDARGAGGKNILFEIGKNTMAAHVSEFPVGTYKKAHRHGPDFHVVILEGRGYSLLWKEGGECQRFDWEPGSMFVPPDQWFHQHFNTGPEPARYLALRVGGRNHGLFPRGNPDKDVKLGGDQIEYEDQEPWINELYGQELAKRGLESRMGTVSTVFEREREDNVMDGLV